MKICSVTNTNITKVNVQAKNKQNVFRGLPYNKNLQIDMIPSYIEKQTPEAVNFFKDLESHIGLDGIKKEVGEYGMLFVRKILQIPQADTFQQCDMTIQNIFNSASKVYNPNKVLSSLFSKLQIISKDRLNLLIGEKNTQNFTKDALKRGYIKPSYSTNNNSYMINGYKVTQNGLKEYQVNAALTNLLEAFSKV